MDLHMERIVCRFSGTPNAKESKKTMKRKDEAFFIGLLELVACQL